MATATELVIMHNGASMKSLSESIAATISVIHVRTLCVSCYEVSF